MSEPIQPRLAIQPLKADGSQQSSQLAISSARNEGMNFLQRTIWEWIPGTPANQGRGKWEDVDRNTDSNNQPLVDYDGKNLYYNDVTAVRGNDVDYVRRGAPPVDLADADNDVGELRNENERDSDRRDDALRNQLGDTLGLDRGAASPRLRPPTAAPQTTSEEVTELANLKNIPKGETIPEAAACTLQNWQNSVTRQRRLEPLAAFDLNNLKLLDNERFLDKEYYERSLMAPQNRPNTAEPAAIEFTEEFDGMILDAGAQEMMHGLHPRSDSGKINFNEKQEIIVVQRPVPIVSEQPNGKFYKYKNDPAKLYAIYLELKDWNEVDLKGDWNIHRDSPSSYIDQLKCFRNPHNLDCANEFLKYLSNSRDHVHWSAPSSAALWKEVLESEKEIAELLFPVKQLIKEGTKVANDGKVLVQRSAKHILAVKERADEANASLAKVESMFKLKEIGKIGEHLILIPDFSSDKKKGLGYEQTQVGRRNFLQNILPKPDPKKRKNPQFNYEKDDRGDEEDYDYPFDNRSHDVLDIFQDENFEPKITLTELIEQYYSDKSKWEKFRDQYYAWINKNKETLQRNNDIVKLLLDYEVKHGILLRQDCSTVAMMLMGTQQIDGTGIELRSGTQTRDAGNQVKAVKTQDQKTAKDQSAGIHLRNGMANSISGEPEGKGKKQPLLEVLNDPLQVGEAVFTMNMAAARQSGVTSPYHFAGVLMAWEDGWLSLESVFDNLKLGRYLTRITPS